MRQTTGPPAIPNGLKVPLQNPLGVLVPSDPGCDFGDCGLANSAFGNGALSDARRADLQRQFEQLFEAFHNLTWALDLTVINGTIYVAAGAHYVAAGALISGGCLDPTPFEPLTCAVMGAAGVEAGAVGASLHVYGTYFLGTYTGPAWRRFLHGIQ